MTEPRKLLRPQIRKQPAAQEPNAPESTVHSAAVQQNESVQIPRVLARIPIVTRNTAFKKVPIAKQPHFNDDTDLHCEVRNAITTEVPASHVAQPMLHQPWQAETVTITANNTTKETQAVNARTAEKLIPVTVQTVAAQSVASIIDDSKLPVTQILIQRFAKHKTIVASVAIIICAVSATIWSLKQRSDQTATNPRPVESTAQPLFVKNKQVTTTDALLQHPSLTNSAPKKLEPLTTKAESKPVASAIEFAKPEPPKLVTPDEIETVGNFVSPQVIPIKTGPVDAIPTMPTQPPQIQMFAASPAENKNIPSAVPSDSTQQIFANPYEPAAQTAARTTSPPVAVPGQPSTTAAPTGSSPLYYSPSGNVIQPNGSAPASPTFR